MKREWDDINGSYKEWKETFARWKEKMRKNAAFMERLLASSEENCLPTPSADGDDL